MKKVALFSLVIVSAVLPFAAFAQSPTYVPPPAGAGGSPITKTQDIIDLINKILFWVATVFWIAAVIFIFYAAFLYLTAAGEDEKVKKASHQFLYAVIAIAVGLLAYGLPLFVKSFLGGQ